MATKKKVTKTPTVKVRLEVMDINEISNSVLLEGTEGNLKYVLMIDADFDQKMVADTVVGDKWDITLKNTIKLKKPTKAAKGTTVLPKGVLCPGSGRDIQGTNISLVQNSWGSAKIPKTKCSDCGKLMALNGGYSGKPYTIRKHNV